MSIEMACFMESCKKKRLPGNAEVYTFQLHPDHVKSIPIDVTNGKASDKKKKATIEINFTLNGPLLRSESTPVPLFNVGKGRRISLVRPTRQSDSFNNTVTVNLEQQLMFDQIAQLYPCNYKCYNLRKMNPFNMVHTESGSSYFAFELPNGEFQVSSDGFLAPRDLHILSRREGGGGFESIVTTSTEELARNMMSRTGFQADAQILGAGGGTTKNESVENRTSEMLQNESGKAFFWSTALQYALVADRSHLKMNQRLQNRIRQLYQDYDQHKGNHKKTAREFNNFFDEVGTHYPHAVTYGGLMMFESTISRNLQEYAIKNNVDLEEQIRLGIDLPEPKGVKLGSASMQETDGSGTGAEESFRKEFRKEKQEYWLLGGGGILMSPENPEAVELDGRVAPVYMDLRPLEDLISPQYFSDPKIYHEFRQEFRKQLCCYVKGTTDSNESTCDCTKAASTEARSWPMVELQVLPKLNDSQVEAVSKGKMLKYTNSRKLPEKATIEEIKLQFVAQSDTDFTQVKRAPSGRLIEGSKGHAVIVSSPLSKPEANKIASDPDDVKAPHIINPANDNAILAQKGDDKTLEKTGFDSFYILDVKYPEERDSSVYAAPIAGLIIAIIDLASGKESPVIRSISQATRARLGRPEPQRFQGNLVDLPDARESTLAEDAVKQIKIPPDLVKKNVATSTLELLGTTVREFSAGLRWSLYFKPYTSSQEQEPHLLVRTVTTVNLPGNKTEEIIGDFQIVRPNDLLEQEALIFEQPGYLLLVKSPLGKLITKKVKKFELAYESGPILIPANLDQAPPDASLHKGLIPVSPRDLPFRESVAAYWPLDDDLLERSGRGEAALRCLSSAPESLISEQALSLPDTSYCSTPEVASVSKQLTFHCDFKIGAEQAATILKQQGMRLFHLRGVPVLGFETGQMIPLTSRMLVPDRWHKLILTLDEEEEWLELMINGELLKEIDLSTVKRLERTTDDEDVESLPEHNWQFYGNHGNDHPAAIDEVLIYHRVLTPEERLLLAQRPRLRTESARAREVLWREADVTSLAGCWEAPNLTPLLFRKEIGASDKTQTRWIRVSQAGPNLFITPLNAPAAEPLLGVIDQKDQVILSRGPVERPHIFWPSRYDSQLKRLFLNEWQLSPTQAELTPAQFEIPPLTRFAWKRVDLTGPWRDVENQVDIVLTQETDRLEATLKLSDETFERKTTGKLSSSYACVFLIDGENLSAEISQDLNHIRFSNGLRWSRIVEGKVVTDPESPTESNPKQEDPVEPVLANLTGTWCICSTNDLVDIRQSASILSLEIIRPSGKLSWKQGKGTLKAMQIEFLFDELQSEAGISANQEWIHFPSGAVWKRLHPRNPVYDRIPKSDSVK